MTIEKQYELHSYGYSSSSTQYGTSVLRTTEKPGGIGVGPQSARGGPKRIIYVITCRTARTNFAAGLGNDTIFSHTKTVQDPWRVHQRLYSSVALL